MMKFEGLIRAMTIAKTPASTAADFGRDVMQHQEWRDEQFKVLVTQSELRLWRPGAPVVAGRRSCLVGVSVACVYDMQLLDTLNEGLAKMGGDKDVIYVFDVLQDLEVKEEVPELPLSPQTPLVLCWESGVVTLRSAGPGARDLLTRRYRHDDIEGNAPTTRD